MKPVDRRPKLETGGSKKHNIGCTEDNGVPVSTDDEAG
jgi:hypothetical protein